LAFAGGGFISVMFYWPFLWKRATVLWIITAILFFALLASEPKIGGFPLKENDNIRLALIIQVVVYTMVGLSIVLLAIADLIRHKNPTALLFFLWILGTFIFALYLNWTVNIRTILPVAPVLGILIMRRIESSLIKPTLVHYGVLILTIFISTLLALSIIWADYCLANSSKKAAHEISSKYISDKRNMWFQGHWGFQYYMEKFGGKSIDFCQLKIREGDIVVIPSGFQNTNITPLPRNVILPTDTIKFRSCNWISIMNGKDGAGFYSSIWGPIPFVFGPTYPETYEIIYF
jgi:hypothetical protein